MIHFLFIITPDYLVELAVISFAELAFNNDAQKLKKKNKKFWGRDAGPLLF
jgi:hypothetical protein